MRVIASSFADKADVAAFRRAKANGLSDNDAFKVGDNGIGCWGDNTSDGPAMCALTPEAMIDKFGSISHAKHAGVNISYTPPHGPKMTITAILADIMPARRYRTTPAQIDLNPATMEALNIPKGAMVEVDWFWA